MELRWPKTEPLGGGGGGIGGTGGLHNSGLVGLVSFYALTVHSRVCACAHILSWDIPLPSAEWLILLGYRIKTSSETKTTAAREYCGAASRRRWLQTGGKMIFSEENKLVNNSDMDIKASFTFPPLTP